MNIFEQAVRQQIRLNVAGNISIEQLYSAKPTSQFISTLEAYEEALTKTLEQLEKPSRRNNVEKSQTRKELELILNIVTSYLDEQESLRKARANEQEFKVKEQELLALIAEKQKDSMKNKSLEQLQEEYENLKKSKEC